MDIMQTYESTIHAIGAMAVLMLCQTIVSDMVGIRLKHTPGASVPADHNNLFFRVTRTVANTNETIAIFILASLFCVLSGASPLYTCYAAWSYVVARLAYAMLYYFNIQILRSIAFGVGLLALVALLVIGTMS